MLLLYSHFVARKIAVLLVSLIAVGCGREAGTYPVPPQQSLALGVDPGHLKAYVEMDDPTIAAYIVNDISPERGLRKWAFKKPELKFQVKDASHLRFVAEFALPEVTYRVTGPVTVSAAVNGQVVGSIRCDHAGDWRMEKPVPEGVVKVDEEIHVTFEANPRWVSPEDGAELSFFLRAAGFTQ
jgi:hypothetical protein